MMHPRPLHGPPVSRRSDPHGVRARFWLTQTLETHDMETEVAPIPPFACAKDADGSEFWLDARGRAWNVARERLEHLDGPALETCPTCGRRAATAGQEGR